MENSRSGILRMLPEGYKAFFPTELPIEINSSTIQNLLSEADRAIGALAAIESLIPNFELIVRRYAEREALLSSQIEGTQSSLIEILANEMNQNTSVDIREVQNYFNALNHGIKRLKQDELPLCLRLIKEMHEILMTNVRGGESNKTPGEFRKSQNWIGGPSPAKAAFCPPPPSEVMNLLSNLEKYFYEEDLPPLMKCALIHYQFETIHPFCDGNGRMGRILITLYLMWKGVLTLPIFYLSLYFKVNRFEYYEYLTIPRKTGNFEKWIEFFLKGVVATAEQVVSMTKRLLSLDKKDRIALAEITKHNNEIIDYIIQNPVIEIKDLENVLKVSYNTAKVIIEQMIDLGILEQLSEGSRNKKYVYRACMNILEEGCENL